MSPSFSLLSVSIGNVDLVGCRESRIFDEKPEKDNVDADEFASARPSRAKVKV